MRLDHMSSVKSVKLGCEGTGEQSLSSHAERLSVSTVSSVFMCMFEIVVKELQVIPLHRLLTTCASQPYPGSHVSPCAGL